MVSPWRLFLIRWAKDESRYQHEEYDDEAKIPTLSAMRLV
jgi:hypothetical protein